MKDSNIIDASTQRLWSLLPKDQIDKVFDQAEIDIDPTFLGFVDVYEKLSEVIPRHFTIVDLGCAYNPQCFFFTEHKKYIAVDFSDCVKFKADNCEIYHMPIEQFIKEHLHKLDLEETFAICSYVPDWGGENRKMVREAFKNVFTYYPHGGYKVEIRKPIN